MAASLARIGLNLKKKEIAMFLGADITAKGPGLRDGELHLESEDLVEFDLVTKEAKDPGVGRFSIWVRTCEEDVTILNEGMDENIIHDSFCFEIQDKDENNISLTLSIKQIKTLKQILENYLTAFYALQALKEEKKVDLI